MSKIPIVQMFSSNGDGTGVTDMAGDYSDVGAGLTDFYVEDQVGSDLYIARMIVDLIDTGSIDANGFGAGATLTNGIKWQVKESDDTVIADLTPEPIKTNSDFGKYAYDVAVRTWGTGPETLGARFTLTRLLGEHLWLRSGQKLVMTVNDDLSVLDEFEVTAQGYVNSKYAGAR